MEIFNTIIIIVSFLAFIISSFIAPLVIIVIMFVCVFNSIKSYRIHRYFKDNVVKVVSNRLEEMSEASEKENIYVDVSKDKLETFNTTDIDSLKDFFYDIFYKFETAYNNLDYNTMKMLSTKQLYQNYYTGISLDLKVGKKRVINDIQRVNVILYEIDSTIAKQVASYVIEVSYINYMLNHKGYVISGNKNNPVTEKFEVVFRKDFERDPILKCPNCGASITGNKCEYCRSVIKDVEFKISSIKRIVK